MSNPIYLGRRRPQLILEYKEFNRHFSCEWGFSTAHSGLINRWQRIGILRLNFQEKPGNPRNILQLRLRKLAGVRQVDGFFRFIQVAALESGQFVDYSKIAKRAKVSRQSITRHFEILEDTLVARRLDNDPDLDPELADLVKHPRFYFFDSGVLNVLRGSFELSPERIGTLFEHVVLNQITNTASARALDLNFHNFRTRGGLEVDFIVKLDGRKTAIECKASETVSSSELNPLRELSRYYPKIRKLVFYRGKRELKDGDIWILPLKKGIENLF